MRVRVVRMIVVFLLGGVGMETLFVEIVNLGSRFFVVWRMGIASIWNFELRVLRM